MEERYEEEKVNEEAKIDRQIQEIMSGSEEGDTKKEKPKRTARLKRWSRKRKLRSRSQKMIPIRFRIRMEITQRHRMPLMRRAADRLALRQLPPLPDSRWTL